MKKKLPLLTLATLLSSIGFTSCSVKDEIIYYNFKPELTSDKWEKIIDEFKKDTGITLKVKTAASGQYESSLRGEMGNRDKPTIFQINGPVGYNNWKDYCSDLTDTTLYKNLSNQSMAVKIDNKAYAIPATVEGYGIIYNKAIVKAYREHAEISGSTKTTYTDADGVLQVKNFNELKTVVEDIQANKGKLGLEGVFSVTGLDASTSWRITGHLFNLPLVGEFGSSTTSIPSEFKFTYAENYRNLLNLYLKNSSSVGNYASAVEKTMAAANGEFTDKKSLMIQNGNWATSDLTSGNSKVKTDDLAYLPMYSGDLGNNVKQSNQGLCVGTESYLTVNSKATAREKENGIRFLEWLFCGNGKERAVKDLAFMPPFKGYDNLKPTDALTLQVYNWMNYSDYVSVPWDFTLVPSTDDQRAALVTDLKAYYNDNLSDAKWTSLVTNAKAKWAELAKTINSNS